MNLLYLLVALSFFYQVSIAQDTETTQEAETIIEDANSTEPIREEFPPLTRRGWYVGDCLDLEAKETYSNYLNTTGLCEGDCVEEIEEDNSTATTETTTDTTDSGTTRRRRPANSGTGRKQKLHAMRKLKSESATKFKGARK